MIAIPCVFVCVGEWGGTVITPPPSRSASGQGYIIPTLRRHWLLIQNSFSCPSEIRPFRIAAHHLPPLSLPGWWPLPCASDAPARPVSCFGRRPPVSADDGVASLVPAGRPLSVLLRPCSTSACSASSRETSRKPRRKRNSRPSRSGVRARDQTGG